MKIRMIAALMGFTLLWGCATLPSDRNLEADTTLSSGLKRIGRAAMEAGRSPETWGPVAAALLLQIDHADRNISDWAVDRTPVFGSRHGADVASEYLLGATGAVYVVTAVAAPEVRDGNQWAGARTRGIAIDTAAMALTVGAAEFIKNTSGRTRPDGSDNRSFPSVHTAGAAVFSTLAARNLDGLSLSPKKEAFYRVGLMALTSGTAWARVEAGEHFPSDVLVGYALGHFTTTLVNGAFLGRHQAENLKVRIEPQRKGIVLGLCWVF